MSQDTGTFDAEVVSANLMEPVFAIGPEDTIVYANDRFLEITQLSEGNLVGGDYDLFERIVDDDFGAFVEAYEAVVAGDSDSERIEFSMRHPEDAPVERRLPAEVRLTPLVRDGVREGAVVVLRDVSERKRYERRLEAQAEQLALLNRLLRHDIRNDAAIISGWAELLVDDVDDDNAERLTKIRDAAEHIDELTREAGEVAALIDESGDMTFEAVRPVEHLRDEVSTVRDNYPEATVSLDVGDVEDARIQGNSLLGPVFGNLLRNAIVHNDRDTPSVDVACSREDGDVVVSVADDGPGIPDDRKEAIFDIGNKGMGSSGMGLGLYLTSTLVDLYDGEIAVDNREPRGTVFTVRLPIFDG